MPSAVEKKLAWRNFVPPVLTKEEWAYIAGFLDGEGCIGVYTRSKNHMGTRQITGAVSYRPRISVTNTNKEVLLWMQSKLGGVVRDRGQIRIGWKPIYHWNLQNVQMIFVICENCIPYMHVKAEQARIVLQFPFNVQCNNWTVEKTTFTEAGKRSLYEATLRLNKRGDGGVYALADQ